MNRWPVTTLSHVSQPPAARYWRTPVAVCILPFYQYPSGPSHDDLPSLLPHNLAAKRLRTLCFAPPQSRNVMAEIPHAVWLPGPSSQTLPLASSMWETPAFALPDDSKVPPMMAGNGTHGSLTPDPFRQPQVGLALHIQGYTASPLSCAAMLLQE